MELTAGRIAWVTYYINTAVVAVMYQYKYVVGTVVLYMFFLCVRIIDASL